MPVFEDIKEGDSKRKLDRCDASDGVKEDVAVSCSTGLSCRAVANQCIARVVTGAALRSRENEIPPNVREMKVAIDISHVISDLGIAADRAGSIQKDIVYSRYRDISSYAADLARGAGGYNGRC